MRPNGVEILHQQSRCLVVDITHADEHTACAFRKKRALLNDTAFCPLQVTQPRLTSTPHNELGTQRQFAFLHHLAQCQ